MVKQTSKRKWKMNILDLYTKKSNLADSPAVRWWGPRGAQRFWLAWTMCSYASLVILTGFGLAAWGRVDVKEHILTFVSCFVAFLLVLATGLLTRMLIRTLDELRTLESSEARIASK